MLVAYAKLALKEDILASSIPDDPYFERTLAEYFPPAIRETYAGRARRAPAAPRDRHERGGQLDGQPRRHHLRVPGPGGGRRDPRAGHPRVRRLPRGLRAAPTTWREVEALDNVVPTAAQTALYLEFRRLLDRVGALVPHVAARRRSTSAPRSSGSAASCASSRPQVPDAAARRRAQARSSGGPPSSSRPACPTSSRCARRSLLDWYSLLDIVDIATETGREPTDVAPLYYLVSERFGIDAMLSKVTAPAPRRPLGRPGPWRAARRPLLGARVADPLGHRGRRRRGRRAGSRSGRRGRRPTRSRCSGQDLADGDPAARQAQHRGPVGGAAHAALGHPGRRLHLTLGPPTSRELSHPMREASTSAPTSVFRLRSVKVPGPRRAAGIRRGAGDLGFGA